MARGRCEVGVASGEVVQGEQELKNELGKCSDDEGDGSLVRRFAARLDDDSDAPPRLASLSLPMRPDDVYWVLLSKKSSERQFRQLKSSWTSMPSIANSTMISAEPSFRRKGESATSCRFVWKSCVVRTGRTKPVVPVPAVELAGDLRHAFSDVSAVTWNREGMADVRSEEAADADSRRSGPGSADAARDSLSSFRVRASGTPSGGKGGRGCVMEP